MKIKYILISCLIITIIIVSILYIKEDHNNKQNYEKTIQKYKNRVHYCEVEEIPVKDEIDKNFLQIYFQGRDNVPEYIFENIEERNEKLGWKYHFYDEKMIQDYLFINYGQKYVDKLNSFKKYAHKADLFRICWLYQNGGIYLDIDIELLVDANKLLNDRLENFTMAHNVVRKHSYQTFISNFLSVNHDTLLNGLIIVNKGNKKLKKCIERVMMIKPEDLDKNYAEILFLIQDTVGKNFKYSFEERYSWRGKGSKFYNKKGEHIANEKYKNYKEGKFIK